MTTLSPALEAITQLVKCRCAMERCSTNRCQYRKAAVSMIMNERINKVNVTMTTALLRMKKIMMAIVLSIYLANKR